MEGEIDSPRIALSSGLARILGDAVGRAAREEAADLHWVSLGQLGTCISVLQQAGATQALMAGPMLVLYAFSILIAWIFAKRKPAES